MGAAAAGRGRGAVRDPARPAHPARADRRRLRRRRWQLRGHRLEDRSAAVRGELVAAGVQLAAYRLGWSRLTGVPIERVSAGFHHVAAKVTLRPVDLLDEAGLLALVTGTAR